MARPHRAEGEYMRDPNRISAILQTLEEVWRLHSDWRFMQLICNIQNTYGSDMFYVEDDELATLIKEMTKPEPIEKRRRSRRNK